MEDSSLNDASLNDASLNDIPPAPELGLADDDFRVHASFGGLAYAMALDFLTVQVEYTTEARARTMMSLNRQVTLGFADASGQSIATSGWPGSSTFVNGQQNGTLTEGWDHVVVVSQSGIAASDVELGNALNNAEEQLVART